MSIFLALSQSGGSDNNNNNSNNNNNNSNDNSNNNNSDSNSSNDIKVDETKCRRNMVALEHKIDLDVEIYKFKKANHWKLTKEKQKEIETTFLSENDLEKSDLVLDAFGASKREAKEKQQFKIKKRVEKQHKIMEYLNRK